LDEGVHVPVPPHAHQDAPPGATGSEPHPAIAAAFAAARGPDDPSGGPADPSVPATGPVRHKAPLRPPSRRAWVAVGLLVALTALPMLVVIFAGRAALRGPDDEPPYRADGGPPVVIEPGPDGAHRPHDAAVAPEASGASGAAPSGPVGAAGGTAGGRAEATPCPTAPGAAAAQAAGGGGAPAGGGSPGDGSGADAGSGATGDGPVAGGAPGGADGAPGGGVPAGDPAHGGASSGDPGDGDGGSPDDDREPPRHPHSGSTESAPGRNFIERVLDELGIPLP
jgi:hypothetical protein